MRGNNALRREGTASNGRFVGMFLQVGTALLLLGLAALILPFEMAPFALTAALGLIGLPELYGGGA